ncbi:hypothetical protein pneo_cds_310 [Pandoravirus neocaledonia]|uniref:Uncharacterized protein n=1 Tax=Pandoravirus neocaledonia TaxID=2107708 RepID=A0A2U7UBT3_9VIRU|nr:hypothetical protein pneo_cds_310 [Pandoravirus neocaledonia]AVK75917.1 hypothetical protein pneo_cds_310 [Pandoravirus neocaledonia]
MDLLRQATPRLGGHVRPSAAGIADGVPMPVPSTPSTARGAVDAPGAGPVPQTIAATPRHTLPQPQHPLAAARVEMASLAASINAAIVGMQASIDSLAARCARIEKRLDQEARRAAEGQRVVADHVESLWRAIDGSREAVNWCWARVTPATEGRAWLRARLVGHRQPQQQQQQAQQHHRQDRADRSYAPDGAHGNGRATDNNGDDGDMVAETGDVERDDVGLVMDVGEGGWLCVRYPMVRAADDAGARCVWMRTTLVDEANGDMRHYWVKAYDLDAQMAFLSEYTNVPPCFDAEPLENEEDDDDDGSADDGDDDDDREEEGKKYRNGGERDTQAQTQGGVGGEAISSDGRRHPRHQTDGDQHGGGRCSGGGDRTGIAGAQGRCHGVRDEPAAPAPIILREGPHINAIGRADGGDRRHRDDGSEYESDDFSSDGEPL